MRPLEQCIESLFSFFFPALNRVPSNRFDNFVEVQYRYVFAIALPYTNPHKYDHYTVSLAHHVIAGWYLKCKLPLRRNFVDYILKGFMTNVQKPFEETKRSGDFINEDSSNRKRSSSLTERGPKNRDRPTLQNLNRIKNDETPDEMVYNFHMELAETCIDFLARHCYSMCSALPKRLPTTDFLLVGAQTKSWLIGHNIVTITTSGCSSVSTKNSLCDRCSLLCKMPGGAPANVFSPLNGSASPELKSSSDSATRTSSTSSFSATAAAVSTLHAIAVCQLFANFLPISSHRSNRPLVKSFARHQTKAKRLAAVAAAHRRWKRCRDAAATLIHWKPASAAKPRRHSSEKRCIRCNKASTDRNRRAFVCVRDGLRFSSADRPATCRG